jgi:hypothetical protein
MQPIAVTAQLLRAQLPDLPLREGATLLARVASRGESNAVIVLAGIPLTAQVPPEVQAGATLRLKVLQITAERITLQIDRGDPGPGPQAADVAARAAGREAAPGGPAGPAPPPAAAARAPQPPAAALQPPNAALAGQPAAPAQFQERVEVRERPARKRSAIGGEPADVVALAFTSPALGRLDLRLELRGQRLLAEVTTPAGLPHAVASGASERLRARLLSAGLDPTVEVHARRDPFDIYA